MCRAVLENCIADGIKTKCTKNEGSVALSEQSIPKEFEAEFSICHQQIAMMIFGHFYAKNGGFKAAKSNLCDEKTCFFIELAHCKCASPFLYVFYLNPNIPVCTGAQR